MTVYGSTALTNLAQASFARSQSRLVAANTSGCELSNGIKSALNNIITQVKNAVPEFVYIAILAIAIAMLFLAFSGRLAQVGRMFIGVLIAVIVISLAGTLSNIFAPSSC